MTKIVFCFAGTGDPGDGYAQATENTSDFHEDVIRVYFRGCQHSEVGNGFLYPDLDSAAIRIRKAFEGNQFDLERLKKEFGDGICLIKGPTDTKEKFEIDSIGLQGFSRGAVTTFATAKRLDDLGIPLDIIANQPVPGQMAGDESAQSIYSKFNDLTQCKNIRTATTFLASHNLENGFIHNQFFQQMIAKFHPDTKVNNWIMPHQSHLEWFRSPLIPMHINREFNKLDYSSRLFTTRDIEREYKNSRIYFTPKEFSQNIFGQDDSIKKDPIYMEQVKRNATKCMESVNILPQVLNDEQASAIEAISKIGLDPAQQKQIIEFMLEDKPRAQNYIQIVNKIHNTCQYLADTTYDRNNMEKHNKINAHSNQYQKEVFVHSYEYLSKSVTSDQDKAQFINQINKARSEFEANATGIDRGIMRKAMKVIFNTLLHLTGLFLITNTLNLAITGNYFFLNDTRSTTLAKQTAGEVIDLINSTEQSSQSFKQDEKIVEKNKDFKNRANDLKADTDVLGDKDELGNDSGLSLS